MKNSGIMKFTDVNELIEVMRGYYGKETEPYFTHLYIMNENDFKKHLARRFIYAFYADKFRGRGCDDWIADYYYDERAGEIWGECVNDFPVDFNFILWSETNKCFYCSLMEWKDDNASVFDDDQWDILYELYDLFNIIELKEETYHLIQKLWIKEDEVTIDDINNLLNENNIYPFGPDEEEDTKKIFS